MNMEKRECSGIFFYEMGSSTNGQWLPCTKRQPAFCLGSILYNKFKSVGQSKCDFGTEVKTFSFTAFIDHFICSNSEDDPQDMKDFLQYEECGLWP